MRYELIIIWDDGKKEIYEYKTIKEAEKVAENMKKVFGGQIAWTGTRKIQVLN